MKSVRIRSFSGPYFPVFSPNAGKYGPEKTPYLDTFDVVEASIIQNIIATQRRIQNPVKHLRWSFMMELFAKISLSVVHYFHKKFFLRCLTGL